MGYRSLYDFGTIMADTDGLTAANNKSNHAVLHRFDIPIEEDISGRSIYWSLFKSKNKERKIFDKLSHQPNRTANFDYQII